MTTIGSNGVVVHGPNALWTLNGNAMGTVENWTLSWSYKILEEDVSNSQIPMQAASNFRGKFSADAILTTDNNFLSLLGITYGDLTVYTSTLLYRDISGGTKTTTFQARFNEPEQKQSKGEFVRYSLKGVLSAVPTGF